MLILIVTVTTVVYVKRKTLTVVIDGQSQKIVTYKNTVGEILKDKSIPLNAKDKISPTVESKVSNNDILTLKRAVPINVSVDGKELSIQSAEENIDLMLKAEGILLKTEDKVKPEKETRLSASLKIEVIRVETKTFTDSVPLDFKTIVKTDGDLPNTHKKSIQEGAKGEKQITTTVTYENSKEVARKIVSEVIKKVPIDKIIVQGTLPILPVSRGGESMAYTKVIKARATAYSPIGGATTAYTASGRKAVRNPGDYSTIAVDPSVIPFGTRLFVEGYGFATAADSGSGITGNTIDVFFNTYNEACSWGVKQVNVYILK